MAECQPDNSSCDDSEEISSNYEALFKTFLRETMYQKKYFAVKKKCEQVQQRNEKLVNRLQHVKKILKQYKKDRRFLMSKLDEHGDAFRDVPVAVTWEEDPLKTLTEPPPYPSTVSAVKKNSATNYTTSTQPPPYHSPLSSAPSRAATILQTYLPKVEASGSKISNTMTLDTTSKVKKVKSEPKDPLAPRKPINAYMMYYQAKRQEVREQFLKEKGIDISHPELTKVLAQQWNALTPEEKRVYYKMYENEKLRYDREMLEYNSDKPVKGESHAVVGVKQEPITSKTEIKQENLG